MLITQQGKILRMASKDIRTIGRATQGVRLIDIEGDDRAVSIARLAEKDDDSREELAKGRSVASRSAALLILAVAACAWPSPERQLLLDFFQACRVVRHHRAGAPRDGVAATPAPTAWSRISRSSSVGRASAGRACARARDVTLERPACGRSAGRRRRRRLDGAGCEQVDGRWMVAAVTRLPASRTSPAASSAPPN